MRRLVTRADLDGLACALILTDNEEFDEIVLVHPQEITDKKVEILPGDIAGQPPLPSRIAGRWFDHHLLTESNEKPPESSTASTAWRRAPPSWCGSTTASRRTSPSWSSETDRFDSAQLDEDDVLQPQGWILLGFTLDPRTGLGDDDDFFLQAASSGCRRRRSRRSCSSPRSAPDHAHVRAERGVLLDAVQRLTARRQRRLHRLPAASRPRRPATAS